MNVVFLIIGIIGLASLAFGMRAQVKWIPYAELHRDNSDDSYARVIKDGGHNALIRWTQVRIIVGLTLTIISLTWLLL